MIEKLPDFKQQLEELDQRLSEPDVMKDMGLYTIDCAFRPV